MGSRTLALLGTWIDIPETGDDVGVEQWMGMTLNWRPFFFPFSANFSFHDVNSYQSQTTAHSIS